MNERHNGLIQNVLEWQGKLRLFGSLDSANSPNRNASGVKAAWSSLIKDSLPRGYNVASAYVVDSCQRFSDLFDIVIYEENDPPTKFSFHGSTIVPVEHTCAIFEVCVALDCEVCLNFEKKVAKLRRLDSLGSGAFPYGGGFGVGSYNAVGVGILALETEHILNTETDSLSEFIQCDSSLIIDIGCVANLGSIGSVVPSGFMISRREEPLIEFLKDLAEYLRARSSAIGADLKAYGSWLEIG